MNVRVYNAFSQTRSADTEVDLSKEKLDAMINFNAPKDPVSYGNALQKMVVKFLKESKRRGILHVAGHFESFINRFLTESVRISRMPNGSLIAFCLIFDFVTNIIPLGGESLETIETVKVYQSIDRMLSDVLRASCTIGNPPFFALGEACRKMREKISLHCGYDYLLRDWYDHDDIDNNCPNNLLIKSLLGLRCYACFEIRSLVRLATGNRLPAELAQLVFENTLDAEGIGRDPRLLAPARDPCDRRVVRCMLPCEHDLRFSPRDEMGLRFAYVSGDDYELLRPTFSHNFESYEAYVQAERDAVQACGLARRSTASSTDPRTRSNRGQVATWPIRLDVGSDLTDPDSYRDTEETDYIF
ncbi:hypothetical protein FB567DRAFT_289306 [Paraphoma chrysanthemicola]|uniref:Uncharacterized protein n=1 Tax=Paraphoma chrysanthemicola TaxID=798071 RepID=A0A8K0W1B2_9PLEO|nr:hypothetical protein FB567DRAFT_289306 [Paraphoma chrysanthemicola]